MSLRNEQCRKVCHILDDVLANRPTERDALIVAVRTAFDELKERKTGRWILSDTQRQEDVDNGNYQFICSECGKADIHSKAVVVSFCWNCGARMDGDDDAKAD